MALPKLGAEAVLLIQQFERNAQRYLRTIDRMGKKTKDLGQKTGAAGPAFTAVGTAMRGTAMAASAAAAGIAALIGVVANSIASFQQHAQELRRFRMQLGGATTDISAFLNAARLTGAQMSHVASATGIFEKKLTDFSLRAAVGSEESHEFERAIGALGIEIKNADGSTRSMNELLPEIADAFEYLGAGAFTTGLAMNLFGRAGRQMLPVLLEGSDAMAESAKRAEELGVILTSKDVKASEEFRRATEELKMSLEGIKNVVARFVLPALTDFAEGATKVMTTIRQLSIMIGAGFKAMAADISSGFEEGAAAEAFEREFARLAGILTEEERLAEESIAIEEERRQKIAEATFARGEVYKKMEELTASYTEKMLAIEEEFARREEDIAIARERQLEDAAQREADRRADLLLAYQRKLEDIYEDYEKRRERRERDNQKKLDDFWAWANLQREKLLNRHLERMQAIRQRFTFAANQAARRNDAVALLQAMERRDMEEKLEKERYTNRRTELEKDIARRLKKLLDGFDEEERKEDERLSDALAKAQKWYRRRLEDLAIALERERRDRELAWQRQDEDLDRARARQEAKVEAWYTEERDRLQEQLDRLNVIIEGGTTTMLQTYQNFVRDYVATTDAFNAAMWQSYSRMPQMRPPGLGTLGTTAATAAGSASTFLEQLMRDLGVSYAGGFQHGGEFIARGPTLALAGEGGPERVRIDPIGRSVHHTHDFGRFGVDVTGVTPSTASQLEPIIVDLLGRITRQIR